MMSNYTERFYDFVAWFYPAIDIFLKGKKKQMIKEVNELPKGSILEIGVGNGKHLHRYKSHTITGIDISARMLSFAQKRKNGHICLIKMNAEHLEFGNEFFDYVVISHTIAVVDKPEKVLQEVHRVLKPNGKLILLNHFTPSNLLKYIDKVFENFSKWFRLKSLFYMSDLKSLDKFIIRKEKKLGLFAYYKLLIMNKK